MPNTVENTRLEIALRLDKILAELDRQVGTTNKAGYYHLAKHAEYILIPFISTAFGIALENANIGKQNMEAVDLWSITDSFYLQVSSELDVSAKVKSTVEAIRQSKKEIISNIPKIYFYFLHPVTDKERKRIVQKYKDSVPAVTEECIMDREMLFAKLCAIADYKALNDLEEKVTYRYNLYDILTKEHFCYSYEELLKPNGYTAVTFPSLEDIEKKKVANFSIVYEMGSALTSKKCVVLYANEGRGKTTISKLLIYSNYKTYKKSVLYYDFNAPKTELSKEHLKSLSDFCNQNDSFIVFDNCHLLSYQNLEYIITIISNCQNERTKFMIAGRNTLELPENDFDAQSIFHFKTGKTDVEDFFKLHSVPLLYLTESLWKVIGKSDANLRTLGIILNDETFAKTGDLDYNAVCKKFYTKFEKILRYYTQLEQNIIRAELESMALQSFQEVDFIQIVEPTTKDYFTKLVNEGYLLYESSQKKYFFPHVADANAFLRGRYGNEYIAKLLIPYDEMLFHKKDISKQALLDIGGRLYYTVRSFDYTSKPLELLTFLRKFHHWIQANVDHNFIFVQLGFLNWYYMMLQYFLEDLEIDNIADYILHHFTLLIASKQRREAILVSHSVDYFPFLGIANNIWKQKFFLLDKLMITEQEKNVYFTREKVKNIKALKRYFNHERKEEIVFLPTKQINVTDKEGLIDNVFYFNLKDKATISKKYFVLDEDIMQGIKQSEEIIFCKFNLSKITTLLQIVIDSNYSKTLKIKFINGIINSTYQYREEIFQKYEREAIEKTYKTYKRIDFSVFENIQQLEQLLNSFSEYLGL